MARLVNITDVCREIFAGGDAPRGNMSLKQTPEYSIPIYSNGEANSGLYGFTNYARVTEPSITISARGTIGYAAIRNEPFLPIVRLITLVPDLKVIDLQYLYYAVQNYHFNGSGTSIPQLTVPMLKDYSFPLPSMESQRKIASILNCVNSLIVLRKQQLAKLDELVKARFVEMFGDLGSPVCPWERSTLVGVCKESEDIKCGPFGTQLAKDEYLSTGVAVWEIPQINSNFKTNPTHFLSLQKAEELKPYSIEPNDIAMSRKGNVGRCALFPADFKPGIIHSDVLRIRVNPEIILPKFLMYQLHYSTAVQHQIGVVSSGAIMAGINVTKLKRIDIHIPPMDLQQQFVGFVDKLDNCRLTVQQGLDKLEVLKKTLMQEYFG